MQWVTLEVDEKLLKSTYGLNVYQRMNVMEANGVIPESHRWGYGVYSGAYIEDDSHIKYQIGSSCD